MAPAGRTGVHFDNGYESEGLAHILESVMRHQTAFSLPVGLAGKDCCRFLNPIQEGSAGASASVAEALHRAGTAPDQFVGV